MNTKIWQCVKEIHEVEQEILKVSNKEIAVNV